MKIAVFLTGIIGMLVLVFFLSLLFAFPIKWLWNSTVTELFGFKEIGVWMAWKLSMLCGLLFKTFGHSSKGS